MKSLNNRGFTLVELLAVLVILISIMSVVVPTVSDSLDRSKEGQAKRNKKILINAAESYIADYKSKIDDSIYEASGSCYVDIEDLVSKNYVDSKLELDESGNALSNAGIIFHVSDYSFEYNDNVSSFPKCIEE